MTFRQREMAAEKRKDTTLLLAPGPGWYSRAPAPGQVLSAGHPGGRLQVLNHFYDLVIPSGVHGQVTKVHWTERVVAVDYHQPLFELKPRATTPIPASGKEKAAGESNPKLDPADERVVTAFTTGIFYARPAPDAPSFVTEGQQIEKGKALGLIEVMKTFNHIVFQGIGSYHRGVVRRILVRDAQEVNLGESLFIIDPLPSGSKKGKP